VIKRGPCRFRWCASRAPGQSGKIYQKDLGPATRRLAAALSEYNPDASWKKVEE
jgi:hypothetical protein